MNNLKIGDKVSDITKNVNKGFPMKISKIENDQATVEFFEGAEARHKVVPISIGSLKIVD